MGLSVGLLAIWLVTLLSDSVEAQVAGKCSGQTCYIASLSTSTNEPFKLQGGKKPSGGNSGGDACIKNAYKTLGVPQPKDLKFVDIQKQKRFKREVGLLNVDSPDDLEAFYNKLAKTWPKQVIGQDSSLEKRQGACKENTLMFARGTTEPGVMGKTVGPVLERELGKAGWSVQGINYDATIAGIYCIGMPGGIKCKDQVDSLARRCPNTKIILAGYSQGAMVARICTAWAGEAAKKQIKGLALFGDPFNGADVKGVPQSRVKTWCATGDGVCKGQFSITAAHMSYVGASTTEAVQWIKNTVKS